MLESTLIFRSRLEMFMENYLHSHRVIRQESSPYCTSTTSPATLKVTEWKSFTKREAHLRHQKSRSAESGISKRSSQAVQFSIKIRHAPAWTPSSSCSSSYNLGESTFAFNHKTCTATSYDEYHIQFCFRKREQSPCGQPLYQNSQF